MYACNGCIYTCIIHVALHVFTHIHINALYTAFTDFMATLNWLLLGLGYKNI